MSDRLSAVGTTLAAVTLLVAALIVIAQVVIRYSEAMPITFGDELSGYLLAFSAFMAAADAFSSRTLPRLVLFVDRLPRHVRYRTEVVELIAGLLFCSLLGVQAWGLTHESWRYQASSILLEIPLYIPQAAMLAGIFLFWVVIAMLLLERVRRLMSHAGQA